MPGQNSTTGFDPGAVRESHIHQDDVRSESLDRPHRGGFESCLADDGNAVVVVQDGSQADTDHFVIVDQEQANRLGLNPHNSRRLLLQPRIRSYDKPVGGRARRSVGQHPVGDWHPSS